MANVRRWYAWLLLAFVASSAAAFGCDGCGRKSGGPVGPTAEATPSAEVPAKRPMLDRPSAPQLDVLEFIKDFSDDPASANTKYTGQLVRVAGVVHELSGERVILHDQLAAVSCTLPPEQASLLVVDQPATVTGFVSPGGGRVAAQLDSCELMAP